MLGQCGGGFSFVAQASGVFQDAFTKVSQHQASGATLHQALAELILEFGKPARECGFGQAYQVRCPREAPGINDVGEKDKIVRVKLEGGHKTSIVPVMELL